MPCSTAAVAIGERIILIDLQKKLDHHINGKEIRKHLSTKYGWNEGQFDMIDWSSHGKMLEKLQMHARPTIHKAIHRYTAGCTQALGNRESTTPHHIVHYAIKKKITTTCINARQQHLQEERYSRSSERHYGGFILHRSFKLV
jgi:homoaconitase/3-isopropylmalate dehydratase large subunit